MSMRTEPAPSSKSAVFGIMRDLAARSRALAADARRYERKLAELVRSLDDTLLDEPAIGPISGAKPLPATGSASSTRPPSRAATETAPLPALTSGKTVRLIGSVAAATATSPTQSTRSRSSAPSANPRRAPTWTAASGRERPSAKRCWLAQASYLARPVQATRRGPLDFEQSTTPPAGRGPRYQSGLLLTRPAATRLLPVALRTCSMRLGCGAVINAPHRVPACEKSTPCRESHAATGGDAQQKRETGLEPATLSLGS